MGTLTVCARKYTNLIIRHRVVYIYTYAVGIPLHRLDLRPARGDIPTRISLLFPLHGQLGEKNMGDAIISAQRIHNKLLFSLFIRLWGVYTMRTKSCGSCVQSAE